MLKTMYEELNLTTISVNTPKRNLYLQCKNTTERIIV